LSGKLHATLTNHPFEVVSIYRVDEANNLLYYFARDGENPYKEQLHRVGLDGNGDVRLTDPKFYHRVDLAPDGKHFIDTYQAHNQPESTRLVSDEGKVLAELNKYDLTEFEKKGFKKVELFTYKAADGVTDLYGMLHFPANFDPNKKYPLLVSVYAGPETNGARETFTQPDRLTEYGFLVATLDSRSAAGRGKKILDSIYLKLGITEVDDQAAGVKALWSRPYLDKTRVGIHGTSYGGYASILCLLRHPDVFQAACGSSSVTDFRHYDTIYTERYMYTPQENKKGYDEGSAMTYAKNLKGRLMIYYGTADDNVHPNNAMQLIRALQNAGKSFEVQVGPDLGHTGLNQNRMMEFFIENLVMRKDKDVTPE
jgi:dipeptidyl-peptidase-4